MNKKLLVIMLSLVCFQAYGQDDITSLISEAKYIYKIQIEPKLDSLIKLDERYNQLLSERKKYSGDPCKLKSNLEKESTENSKLINNLQKEIDNLTQVQANVRKTILLKYTPYLDKPLSEIDSLELHKISNICKVYKDVDSEINGFYENIDRYTIYKKNYERARKVCASMFNYNDVETSLQKLDEIKDVNDEQRKDVELIRNQLSCFAEGVNYLKEFIDELNEKRNERRYIWEDLVIDRDYIWEDLSVDFDKYIMNVPYLKQAYEQYMTILEADPMAHPQIEEEILAL